MRVRCLCSCTRVSLVVLSFVGLFCRAPDRGPGSTGGKQPSFSYTSHHCLQEAQCCPPCGPPEVPYTFCPCGAQWFIIMSFLHTGPSIFFLRSTVSSQKYLLNLQANTRLRYFFLLRFTSWLFKKEIVLCLKHILNMQAFSNIVEWFLLHFSLFLQLPNISTSKSTVIERKL